MSKGNSTDRKPRFKKLFERGRLGLMDVRNRIVMAPMGTNFATEDGFVTEIMKDYYEERAKGGVGLIIVEETCVDFAIGRNLTRQLSIDDDRFIPGLQGLAQTVQRHGARIAVQLSHGGRAAISSITGRQPVAPSPITHPWWELPKELTVSEVADIVAAFGQAAERAKEAGFDAVEIQGGHSYLIAQFLSSASNKRADNYGGALENRARFLIEVIRSVKEAAGDAFPVLCRLNGREYDVDGGITIEEAKQVARMAQQAGADAIHVSAYGYGTNTIVVMPESPGRNVYLAEAVKQAVTVPVIAVGRIDAELGERILRERKADFIAIGRGLLADPQLPNKVAEGRLDDVAPCIACLHCIDCILVQNRPIECTVNASLGKERTYELRQTGRSKSVLVVGGGPAGLEAARVAALRGHRVRLCDKGHILGGQLLLAAVPPRKDRIEPLRRYLETQVRRLGVRVEVDEEVTPALVEAMGPDELILATGASAAIPEIPGIRQAQAVTAVDVLAGKAKVGDTVVVIGGELVGCETADHLAEKGKRVTVVRRGPRMATKVMPLLRRELLDRMAAKGITMLTGVEYLGLADGGLAIKTKEGKRQIIEADTVVLAAGAKANNGLLNTLKNDVPHIRSIGDCVEPRGIAEAIAEGARAGREV